MMAGSLELTYVAKVIALEAGEPWCGSLWSCKKQPTWLRLALRV